MAAGLLVFPGANPSRDRQGSRVPAQIWHYQNGAPGTPKVVYADSGLTTPLSHPVTSDALGVFPLVYADTAQAYTAVWSTIELDPQTRTIDDFTSSTAANTVTLEETVSVYNDTVGVYNDTVGVYNDAVALYGSLTDVNNAVAASEAARDDALQAVIDAQAQVVLAADQVTLAAAQVALATTQAEDAATSASAALASEGEATTQAGIAATQAGLAALAVLDAKSASADVLFTFSTTTTDSDPGAGNLRLNDPSPASATYVYVDNTEKGGADITAFLDSLDDSASTIKGTLYLKEGATSNIAIYSVTGAVVDGTGYRKVPVAYIAGSGSAFTNAATVGFSFSRNGDPASTASVGYAAKTSAYSAVASDWGKVIEATSGTWALTLPSAAGVGSGFYFYVNQTGSGVVTVTPSGGQTVDGATTLGLVLGDAILIQSDGSNWHTIRINRVLSPQFIARDEKASGTDGGTATSGAWNSRTLNTVHKSAPWASLSGNQVTLAPGTYYVRARSPATGSSSSPIKTRIYNVTGSAVLGYGDQISSGPYGGCSEAAIEFTVAVSTAIRVDTYYAGTPSSNSLGSAASVGTEIYTTIEITKR